MRKIFEKMKESCKSKKIVSVFAVAFLITLVTGVTYAIFSSTSTSNANTITSGTVAMSYTETSNIITINDALPMNDTNGKAQSDYFDFSVTSNLTLNNGDPSSDISYDIILEPLSVDTGYTALTSSQIKVYLENKDTNSSLVAPTLISNLTDTSTNKILLSTKHIHSYGTNTVTTNYRLRAWIDEDVDSSGWTGSTKNEYKFRININGEVDYLDKDALTFYNLMSNNVNTNSANDNNPGSFLYNGTDDNGGNKNVYYYRGNVTNNNVLFGGFCWKMVRTTSTGGVKLIYNGVASSGTCNNTGTSSQLTSTSAFNTYDSTSEDSLQKYGSPAFAGYMYGTAFYNMIIALESIASDSTYSSVSFYFGKTVTYSNGTYTLNTTTSYTGADLPDNIAAISSNGYYYTCMSNTATCSTVYYITDYSDASNYRDAALLPLTDGDTITTAFDKMFTNTNNSAAKTAIDTWYSANLSSYSSYLENTVFCNDRSFASGTYGGNIGAGMTAVSNKTSKNNITPLQNNNLIGTQKSDSIKFMGRTLFGSPKASLYSAAFERIYSFSPSLVCTNQNDRFTLSTSNGGTSNYGNNALTYPVGLITLDEIYMATETNTNNNYLHTESDYWTMTPLKISYQTSVGAVESEDNISAENIVASYGLRPVISLKSGTEYSSGNGTASSPYVVKTNA